MNIFNPYELLNVKTTSSLEDIKKSYYELIKLVHPDRGGTKEDTIAIKNAYEYVKKEIENVDYSLTVEVLLDKFKQFCSTQEEIIPPLNDILRESNIKLFNDRFNNKFNEANYSILNENGYGDLMDKSEIILEYNPDDILPVTNEFIKEENINIEKNEYADTSLATYYDNGSPLNIICYNYTNDNKNSFTRKLSKLFMSDYKESFINKNIELKTERISELNENPIKDLDSLISEREQQIDILNSINMPITHFINSKKTSEHKSEEIEFLIHG